MNTADSDSSEPDDAALVRRAQRELPYVQDAYTALMKRYEPVLLKYCSRYLRDTAEAEDVVQEILISVFHSLPAFEQRHSFKAWLFRVAHNLCTSRYRQIRRRIQVLEAYRQQSFLEAAGHDSPESLAQKTDIAAYLEALSDVDRRVLMLRFGAGLDISEIAEVTGQKLSATKMQLYRAAERLRARVRSRGGSKNSQRTGK